MGQKSKLMLDNRTGFNNNIVTGRGKKEPFRITDNVMKWGKYRGKKLSEVPRSYLEWMLKEMDLSTTRIKAIKDVLK